MEIIVPHDTVKRKNVTIYRYHDNSAAAFTRLNTRSSANYTDGNYYVGDGFIVLYTTKFSTYAVVYATAEGASGGGSMTLTVAENGTYIIIPASAKPPVSDICGTIEVAQGNTVPFHLTSGKDTDLTFAAGNEKVSLTRVFTKYANDTAYYGAYGHGKPSETTGIYANGVKLFEVKVVKAPYKSDTTVNVTTKTTGQIYWFLIKPDDAAAKVTYTAGNGKVLQTLSKGKQKDGNYLFGFKITGKSGDKSGVYVQINGENYCTFNVGVK